MRAAAQIEMLMNINAEQLKLLQELRDMRNGPPAEGAGAEFP